MIRKYVMIVDTDKQPFIDCSLKVFFQNAEYISFEEEELTKDDEDLLEDWPTDDTQAY